jgi:hypothetical protein
MSGKTKKDMRRKPPAAAAPQGAAATAGAGFAETAKRTINDFHKLAENDVYLQLYTTGAHDRLAEEFLRFFRHFLTNDYSGLSAKSGLILNRLVGAFLFILSRPDFQIPQKYLVDMVELNPIIANVVALSSYRTTDPQLSLILRQPRNFAKLLILCSPRNAIQIDPRQLFAVDANAASLWYFLYFKTPGTYANPLVFENMRRHIRYLDDRLILPDHQVLLAYFHATYIDNDNQAPIKRKINGLIQEFTRSVAVRNRPDGKTIAIITSKWFPSSSVYRCYAKAVRALAERFPLELVHLGPARPDLDGSLFRRLRNMTVCDNRIDIRDVADNPFQLAFYPDIGMDVESLYTSNLRLAPIQAMAYGHPSSTFGSQIDYFIGGMDLELLEDAETNYAERLVVIPGNGQPTAQPTHFDAEKAAQAALTRTDDTIVVNCPWSQDKTNYPLLRCLQEIRDRARKKVLFRFYPNEGLLRMNYFLPYRRDLEELLGSDRIEIHTIFGQAYMEKMASGHLALDSHPFAGYNTVIDCLLLGIPLVSLEGRKSIERVGSALLRRFGLDELVAATIDDYVAKAVRLIDEPDRRAAFSARLRGLDLKEILFTRDTGAEFAHAIQYLIENHDRLQAEGNRSPIALRGGIRQGSAT